MRLGIMKGTTTDGLPIASMQLAELLLEHDLEGPGIDDLVLLQRLRELLAHRVARRPALQRGDAILRRHRLAVVPFQPVAQLEGPGQAVVAGRPAVDHLRLDLELLVHGEQRVVEHVAVIARDVGAAPDRIEHLHVGMHDDAQRLRRGDGRQRSGDGSGCNASTKRRMEWSLDKCEDQTLGRLGRACHRVSRAGPESASPATMRGGGGMLAACKAGDGHVY